jgi:hypothetical protein
MFRVKDKFLYLYRQLTFTGESSVMFNKIVLPITTAVRTQMYETYILTAVGT